MEKKEFEAISKVLCDMGIPMQLRGWDCIVTALPLVFKRTPISEIYRIVSIVCGGNAAAVERSIRYATEVSIDRISQDDIIEIYGNSLPLSGLPTNTQLLVTAARRVYGFTPYCRS